MLKCLQIKIRHLELSQVTSVGGLSEEASIRVNRLRVQSQLCRKASASLLRAVNKSS